MSEVVLFDELAAGDYRIGVITLNSEKSLNALSLPMAEKMLPKLQAWANDDGISCVWLQGAGEKAFCAGGDIVAMYNAMKAKPGVLVDEVRDFFTLEYELDYALQTFPKPLVVWGHGIVMGGGMGLMNGGSHRIVTERSLLAMPEITIGLYPDVGATYFLNQMPAGCGLFLGLTGAHMNAADARYLNLADHFLGADKKQALLDALTQVSWGDTARINHQKVTDTITAMVKQDATQAPAPQVEPLQAHISQLTTADDIATVVNNIVNDDRENDWLAKARKNLQHGCPTTAHIVWNQLQLGSDLSLADCFRLELTLSTNCAVKGDFAEGIRALLIDKDRKPAWQYGTVADVPAETIDAFFQPPWGEQPHPLANLGK